MKTKKAGITREQAEKLADSIKARCETLTEDAGQGLESRTWDDALDVLLDWARELTGDVDRSRSLLALSSFLVGSDKAREKKHRAAQKDPLLALKCKECGADQDAYGSTCYEVNGGKVTDDNAEGLHHDACGYCDKCPDCLEDKTWIRPSMDERITTVGMWEKRKVAL